MSYPTFPPPSPKFGAIHWFNLEKLTPTQRETVETTLKEGLKAQTDTPLGGYTRQLITNSWCETQLRDEFKRSTYPKIESYAKPHADEKPPFVAIDLGQGRKPDLNQNVTMGKPNIAIATGWYGDKPMDDYIRQLAQDAFVKAEVPEDVRKQAYVIEGENNDTTIATSTERKGKIAYTGETQGWQQGTQFRARQDAWIKAGQYGKQVYEW